MNRRGQKIAEKVAPAMEPGEEVRYAYTTQTASPAWALLTWLIVLFSGLRTVVVTDRNLYVLHNKWPQTYKFNDEPDVKTPLADARIETGKTWLRVDGGGKLYVGLALRKHIRAVEQLTSAAAHGLPATAG